MKLVEVPILRAESLTKTYRPGDNPLTVFTGVDLTINQGDRVALIGSSGAGKSTLLHLLGLLDAPSSGQIYFRGQPMLGRKADEIAEWRNREAGFVWQMNTLLPEFTALENVMMPLLIRGVARAEAADAAAAQLEKVGLAGRGRHRAGELSGGEQQRAVLARALVGRPSLLLADEPTGNLDERTGMKVIELLEQMHQDFSLTSIYVTHNPAFAARAPRILELKEGALHERAGNEEKPR
ncbi:MAG: ABC transporter ATP-binding protein [Candidatus Solibacter sp.]|nr:ABC transporter ATP-binding protein [Candidatus Solibacter sp.]